MGEIIYTGRHSVRIVTKEGATDVKASFSTVDNGKPAKPERLDFPEGSLESLRPFLRPVFDKTGSDDEAYWANLVHNAPFDEQTAVNKLRQAGKSHLDVAEALVMGDPLVQRNLAFHQLTDEDVEAKISEVAGILLPLYNYR